MDSETVFRMILLVCVICIGVIRVYSQSKISRDTKRFSFKEGGVGVGVYAANLPGVGVEFDWFEAQIP